MEHIECCICDAMIPDFGHNPDPLNGGKGRCCSACNMSLVIPARIKMLFKND